MIAHCLFEQSGTFKNEFKKLGFNAYDYDILNDYNETDYQIDLFKEIKAGYNDQQSIFDHINSDDIIFAFFPCTRFESQIMLHFRGEAAQQKNWDDLHKLQKDMDLHISLHENYMLICMLAAIVLKRGLRMVFENPYSHPHYLNMFWCLKPSIIDNNRRDNGDYMKKPTQFWFIGFEPKQNLVFEPITYLPYRLSKTIKVDNGFSRSVIRSEISSQYANRFIRQYIID